MDLTVRTYDPKQIIITYGALVLTGYAEGTFANIDRDGDAFETSRGADGGVDRVNKNAFNFKVTFTLKQTSPSNDALSAILAADQLSNLGTLPLAITDLNGTTLFAAAQSWISKDPSSDFGDTMSSREWTLMTGPGANLVGSN